MGHLKWLNPMREGGTCSLIVYKLYTKVLCIILNLKRFGNDPHVFVI